jgi:hypothetical protein
MIMLKSGIAVEMGWYSTIGVSRDALPTAGLAE